MLRMHQNLVAGSSKCDGGLFEGWKVLCKEVLLLRRCGVFSCVQTQPLLHQVDGRSQDDVVPACARNQGVTAVCFSRDEVGGPQAVRSSGGEI